jgi:hypothetical protein
VQKAVRVALLLAVILLASYLRITGLTWGLNGGYGHYRNFQPDELVSLREKSISTTGPQSTLVCKNEAGVNNAHAPVNAIAHAGDKALRTTAYPAPECRTKSESDGQSRDAEEPKNWGVNPRF